MKKYSKEHVTRITKLVIAEFRKEEGWKENILSLLLSLGISSGAMADTDDMHKALQGLNHKPIGSVKIEVVKNSGGKIDIKLGEVHIKGFALGTAGNTLSDLEIVGPKGSDTPKGLAEAKFLMKSIQESDELHK
jgi:hypothetical protein